MKLSLGIEELDEILGGVNPQSLILVHESDPASLGKLIALEIMRSKLDSDNLVGYFNIGTPLNVMFRIIENAGIDWRRHLKENRLMIVDTFGSLYDLKVDLDNIWYLRKPIDMDTLNDKYIETIREHKEKWKKLGMFKGRELWGIAIAISDYIPIFGLIPTQRYVEVVDLQRTKAEVYKKYPAGTNVWVYSGNDTVVLPLIYRKADYILKTYSETEDGEIKRKLRIVKPIGNGDSIELSYRVKNHRIVFD